MGSDTLSPKSAFAAARDAIRNLAVKMRLIENTDEEDEETTEHTGYTMRPKDTHIPPRREATPPRSAAARTPSRAPKAPAGRRAPLEGEVIRAPKRGSAAPERKVDTAVFYVDSLINCTHAIKAVIEGTSVIVHFVDTDRVTSQRIIDTLSGAAFALNAKIKKVEDNTYLIAPRGMNINVVRPSERRY